MSDAGVVGGVGNGGLNLVKRDSDFVTLLFNSNELSKLTKGILVEQY